MSRLTQPRSRARWVPTAGHEAQLLLAATFVFIVLIGGANPGPPFDPLARPLPLSQALRSFCDYLRDMPRDNDLVDRLVLAGLGLFLLTCVTSRFPRMSSRSSHFVPWRSSQLSTWPAGQSPRLPANNWRC